jgi:hypothetical protein
MYWKIVNCFRENNNNFGPIVKLKVDEIFENVNNVEVVSYKSGIMSNFLINDWSKNLFDMNLYESSGINEKLNVLLLLDSFTCHWNTDFDKSYNSNLFIIELVKIPPNTTSFAQPQDTGFNYELKYFIKIFVEHIAVDDIKIDNKNRLTIIKLFSLLWNQMCSEKFNNLIRHAWYSSGYLENDFKFENMREICFNIKFVNCDIITCNNSCFIKCSHCSKLLCIKHFYLKKLKLIQFVI